MYPLLMICGEVVAAQGIIKFDSGMALRKAAKTKGMSAGWVFTRVYLRGYGTMAC